jgi:hypothetical protein
VTGSAGKVLGSAGKVVGSDGKVLGSHQKSPGYFMGATDNFMGATDRCIEKVEYSLSRCPEWSIRADRRKKFIWRTVMAVPRKIGVFI